MCVKEISDLVSLSASASSLGGTPAAMPTDAKSDISFITFLVDVLGGLGSKLREVSVVANKEEGRSCRIQLPTGE